VSASLVDYTLSLIPKIVASEVVHTAHSTHATSRRHRGHASGLFGFFGDRRLVVISNDAALTAFSSALPTTLVGSMTPASSRLANSSVRAVEAEIALALPQCSTHLLTPEGISLPCHMQC
jgi:hypothetical protein